jgi:Cd2+/Zn2+-exporting ATPase
VKGGVHLENLGRLKAIAFDKTGTLTRGRPEVTDVEIFDSEFLSSDLPASQNRNSQITNDKSQLLSLAASLESRSAHPLAQAVVRAAQVEQITPAPVENFGSATGKGLRGTVNGQAVLIGTLNWLNENNVAVSDEARSRIHSLQDRGKTVVLVAADNTLLGLIALADIRREQAPEVMRELQEEGVAHTIMLTGDNERVAANIAKQVGVTDVRANLSPEDKFNVIRDLTAQYGSVGMVGDGVNDAPALAHATVGIAMGGAGTDVALETADVALMADDLSKLPFAVGLGRATRNVIIQNLVISLGVIGFLILSSLTGFVGLGIAILFHEGSTLVVVANALRLLGYKNT